MAGLFRDKVALVTGGASGIGAAAAERFAQEGAAVVVADRDLAGAEKMAGLIEQKGGRAIAVGCDVSVEADNEKAVAACNSHFGGLDAAFLNAGVFATNPEEAPFDMEAFERMIAINLRGAFFGLKAVMGGIRKGGAAVVTSSASGVTGLPSAAAYSTAKHGVLGLVKSATKAYAMRGARVNAICPGGVYTPLVGVTDVAPLVDPETLEMPEYRGHLVPQHVAELALFLASRRSAGIMGQALMIDAGFGVTFPPFE